MIFDSMMCYDFLILFYLSIRYKQRQEFFFKRNLFGMIRASLIVLSLIPFLWHLERRTIRFWAIMRILIDVGLFAWLFCTIYQPFLVVIYRDIENGKSGVDPDRAKIEFICVIFVVFLSLLCEVLLFYVFWKRFVKLRMMKRKPVQDSKKSSESGRT